MSYTDLLISTCTTRRYTEGAADAYGIPAKTWADNLTSEPCRLVSVTGQEFRVGARVVVADYQLFVGDSDITEQDRIVLDSITYEVLLVKEHKDWVGAHHKELMLAVVR